MEYPEKEVYYHHWCPLCAHKDEYKRTPNSDGTICLDVCDACHDCLNQPTNWNSRKPINFEEKESK